MSLSSSKSSEEQQRPQDSTRVDEYQRNQKHRHTHHRHHHHFSHEQNKAQYQKNHQLYPHRQHDASHRPKHHRFLYLLVGGLFVLIGFTCYQNARQVSHLVRHYDDTVHILRQLEGQQQHQEQKGQYPEERRQHPFSFLVDAEHTKTDEDTRSNNPHGTPDGTFNGLNVYYRDGNNNSDEQRYSSVRCVGGSHTDEQHVNRNTSFLFRSCHFRHLCFNLTSQRYVVFRSPTERPRGSSSGNGAGAGGTSIHADTTIGNYTFQNPPVAWNSTFTFHYPPQPMLMSTTLTTGDKTVSLGAFDRQMAARNLGLDYLQWFPDIIDHADENSNADTPPVPYYQLDDDVVWVPWQPIGGQNPGHLLWDSFLAIYKLLSLFGLQEPQNDSHQFKNPKLLLSRVRMGGHKWGTCEMTESVYTNCRKRIAKFVPLMNLAGGPESFSDTNAFVLNITTEASYPSNGKINGNDNDGRKSHPRSDLVCARTGVAGIGMLTDHGMGTHGQQMDDYREHRFVGQGMILRQFRDYAMHNLKIASKSPSRPQSTPYKIVFSANSTNNEIRRTDFVAQVAACRKSFENTNDVQITAVDFSTMSLVDQVQLVSETAILVTTAGGGAATATFLPNGASVFLYYGVGKKDGVPLLLDFGIFENAGYLRPHWMPLQSLRDEKATSALVRSIHFELEQLRHEQEQSTKS